MNEKKMREINTHAKVLLRDWLGTLVAKADENNIPLNKVKGMLPKQEYIMVNGKARLSAYSFKWVVKGLKTLSSRSPQRDISTFKMEHIEALYKHQAGGYA